MKMVRKMMFLAMALLLSLSLLLTCYGAGAGVKYPTKNVELIVPYSTGGGTDSLARLVAAELGKKWGKTVVVVNRPGAATLIGTAEIVRSKNDGYTIGMTSNYDYLLTLLSGNNTQYKYQDLEYIASVNTTANILVAKNGSPFNSLADLINYAKKNPGKLTVSVSGQTHVAELAMLGKAAGINLTPIMFTSGGDSLNALLGGHTDLGLFDKNFYAQTSEKGCKTIGTFAGERLTPIKEVPTMKEQGYNVATETYRVFVAPKGTPKSIINTIAVAIKQATDTAEFKENFSQMGEIYAYRSGKELEQRLKSNYEAIKRVVAENPAKFGGK
jgi:tripartite-type tricarboxylate transporter receptor subunit TctC